MTPNEIRIEFIKCQPRTGITKISKYLGVTPAAVHRVIERTSVSERIMVAVAEAIGQPRERVFPEHQFKS